MAARGRKRKMVARYPSGQIVHAHREGERPAQVVATVLAYRARQLGDRHAHHAGRIEAGYELGRLYLTGMLTRRQHDAGLAVCRLYDAYHRACGYPSIHPKAMDWSMVSRGLPCMVEDEADVRKLSDRYMAMSSAIADCGRQAVSTVRSLCVEDTITRDWPDRAMRDLRTGLNSAANFFGLPDEHACEAESAMLLK